MRRCARCWPNPPRSSLRPAMAEPQLITAIGPSPTSPARVRPPVARAAAGRRRAGALARGSRASTRRRWRPASPWRPGRGRELVLPAGAHALLATSRHRRRPRGRARARAEDDPGRPDRRASPRAGRREHGIHVHASLYERATRGRPGLQHRDLRGPGRRGRRADAQAPHPGHRGLLRGPLLPARATTTTATRSSTRRRQLGLPDVLGPVVPRARAGLLAGAARRSSSTRPRSARSPTTPASTPSRCGSA